jgi:hypothetical protein
MLQITLLSIVVIYLVYFLFNVFIRKRRVYDLTYKARIIDVSVDTVIRQHSPYCMFCYYIIKVKLKLDNGNTEFVYGEDCISKEDLIKDRLHIFNKDEEVIFSCKDIYLMSLKSKYVFSDRYERNIEKI